jgi:hypothetical protein
MSKSPRIATSEPGWRQVKSKVVDGQQVFKIETVDAWVTQDGVAIPAPTDDYRLVEVISPLCQDTEERLLHRVKLSTLH